jgi:hypothetical protein
LFVVLLYFNIFVVTMSFFFFIFIYKYTYLKITFRSHTALNLKFVFENAYLLHDILFYCSSTPPPQGYDFQRDIDLLWQMESTSHRSASTPIHQGQTYPYSWSVRLFYTYIGIHTLMIFFLKSENIHAAFPYVWKTLLSLTHM